jgi:hypothetical protein
MRHGFFICTVIASLVVCLNASAQQPANANSANSNHPVAAQPVAEPPGAPVSATENLPSEPGADAAEVSGTVTDVGGDLIPGATVALDSTDPASHQTQSANDSAFFQFKGLKAGVSYRVTVSAKGFDNWVSSPVVLTAGQFFDVPGIKLKLEDAVSSVTVYSSTEQIATQQVELEEHQRVLGIIPNFYVVYDAKDAVPLTTKLKFQMAYRVAIDPVSLIGAATLAGMNQAGDTPNYRQGAIGYGERFGAAYADGVTDIMFGGAILPSLLHQDPRYFYQGTGTVKSRLMHAMSAPFICRSDSGKNEINFSSMGGDLISASISNAYYPASNRGASLVFEGFALSTGERVVSTVIQEFLLKKLTPGAKNRE